MGSNSHVEFTFVEQVKLHIEEVRKLIPFTKRSGFSKSDHLVKYFGVAYDDFRKEVWVGKLNMNNLTTSPAYIILA